MKKTRKTEEINEEDLVKENIQKRFKSMFSGKGEPLSNMSIQQVEALKSRVSELEAQLAQELPAGDREPLTPARATAFQAETARESNMNLEKTVSQRQTALWISGTFIAVTLAFLGFAIYALLVLQGGKPDSSDPYLIPFIGLMVLLTVIGHVLIRRDRVALGGWILYLIDAIFLPIAMVLFLEGVYALASVYLVIFASLFIAFVISRASRWKAIGTAIGAVLAIVAVELWHPGFRVSNNHLETLIPFLVGLTILLILIYFIRQTFTGNIRVKLIASFLAIALLSMGVVAFMAQQSLSTNLAATVDSRLTELANAKAAEIGQAVDKESSLLESLALNEKLQDAAVIANKTNPLSQAEIEQLDQEWRNADAGDRNTDPLVARVLSNSFSDELRQFQEQFPEHVEIFLTDGQGLNIASTNRTSDYYQADEEWWQTAYQDGLFIGQPAFDQSSKTFAINVATAVRKDGTGEVLGILRTTVNFTKLSELLTGGLFGQTGHTEIYLPDGKELTLEPQKDGALELTLTDAEIDLNLLAQSADSSAAVFHNGVPALASQAAITVLGDTSQHAQAINKLNWRIIVLQDRVEALQPVTVQTRNILVLVIIVSLAVILAAFILARVISAPLIELNIVAKKVASGDLTAMAKVKTHDEIAALATTFNNMTAQLRDLFGSLEQRVLDRTHDLELASEVGRSVSEKVGDLTEMLSQAVELIRTRFDLYYTQIYLVDPLGKKITLRAGTGEVGKELLQRGHSLPLSSSSLNGRAATEMHAIIVSDTHDHPNFLPNPLLPKTRSEMVVPLIVGGKVVGVLDMQGQQPGTLNETNLPAFEALAGQLAIAIQNAALFAEAEASRTAVEAQVRDLTQQGWQNLLDGIDHGQKIGYGFEQSNIVRLQSEALSKRSKESDLSIPIAITGTKIGEIQLPMEQDHTWTANELELIKATGAQLAQHIENLRLLAQAEKYRSEAEQAIRRLTHESWDTYLQTHAETEPGYMFDLTEVRPLPEKNNGASNHSIKHPMTIRDEFIGELTVDAPDNSEEAAEIMAAVAEQLSGHIENLRLSELNERNAQREQALRQITIALRSSTNPATILRTAVHELGSILGRRTVVQLADPGRANPSESAVSNKTGSDSPANQS
ncbi:MAG TPA: GAF domain-containing protein [Anaerolineales bacterium]|nr:GAF domain-containing protein [Anaerolineales bacterium]